LKLFPLYPLPTQSFLSKGESSGGGEEKHRLMEQIKLYTRS